MSTYSSKDVGFVLLGGRNLLGTLTTLQDSVEQLSQESTVLGDTWSQFTGLGIKKGALSQGGFYDDAAGSVNEALGMNPELGASKTISAISPALTISANTQANPSIVTVTAAHNMNAGDTVVIAGSNSNPVIDGTHVVTVIDATHFSVPINVTTGAGTAGTVVRGTPVHITTSTAHGLAVGDVVIVSGTDSTPVIDGTRVVLRVLDTTHVMLGATITDVGTTGALAMWSEYVGSNRVFMYNLEGNVLAKHFVGFEGAIEVKYDRGVALEKLHTANAVYNPSGAIEEGALLVTYGTRVAAGDTNAAHVDNAVDPGNTVIPITSNSLANPTVVTTPVAHGLSDGDVVLIAGVSSSDPTINGERTVTVTGLNTFTVPVNVTTPGTGGTLTYGSTHHGGAAYLAVSALTLGGYDNLDVRVQHSPDHTTWADLALFTVVTASPAAERKVVAAATVVDRYLSATWAFTGAGAGPSATFVVGFVRA